MSSIPDAADLHNIPQVKSMGILNRDEGYDAAMPGIVRFTSPEQAAGYFMLGETSKTSAAGKERGKTRSPFTQPFFPAKHGLQAKRFAELAATMPGVTMWLMNTGYIGGEANDAKENKALNIKIRHSSAMLEAVLSETSSGRRTRTSATRSSMSTRPKTRSSSKRCPPRFSTRAASTTAVGGTPTTSSGSAT